MKIDEVQNNDWMGYDLVHDNINMLIKVRED